MQTFQGKVSCLGPDGSYSAQAARILFPRAKLLFAKDFAEATGLLRGAAQYAVLPVENSIRGGVVQNLDLLAKAELFALKELVLPIDHRLAKLNGVKDGDVKEIYSHEQAIWQCRGYLQTHFPNAKLIFTPSTADSLSRLDSHSAGIVGAHLARAGIELSNENIADEKRNYTRFLCLSLAGGALPPTSEKIFLTAVCLHKAGALFSFLEVFAKRGINLTRIESRPVPAQFGQYRFFIEMKGDIGDSNVAAAMQEAQKNCMELRLLGAY